MAARFTRLASVRVLPQGLPHRFPGPVVAAIQVVGWVTRPRGPILKAARQPGVGSHVSMSRILYPRTKHFHAHEGVPPCPPQVVGIADTNLLAIPGGRIDFPEWPLIPIDGNPLGGVAADLLQRLRIPAGQADGMNFPFLRLVLVHEINHPPVPVLGPPFVNHLVEHVIEFRDGIDDSLKVFRLHFANIGPLQVDGAAVGLLGIEMVDVVVAVVGMRPPRITRAVLFLFAETLEQLHRAVDAVVAHLGNSGMHPFKLAGLNFVRSDLGSPSLAVPGPVRRYGNGSKRILSWVQGA